MTSVRLIADDLTGALDGGAPFAGRGWSTALCLVPLAGQRSRGDPGAQVTLASTDSRRLPGDQAAQQVAAHLRQHPVAQDTLLIKKVDSLLRGPYGAELRALMDGTQRRTAIICPALPRMGRWLRDGRLWADGRELNEGERFADEPSSSPQVALGAAFPGWPLQRFEGSARQEGLLLADASTDADLDQLVERVWSARDGVVWVGSSGLSAALARKLGDAGVAPAASSQPDPRRPLLLVIGSRTERTQAEINALLASAPWQPVSVDASKTALRHFVLDNITLLIVPEQDVGNEAATRMLADSALHAIRTQAPDVAVVGGETLAALVAGLAPERVQVLGPALAGFEAMALRRGGCANELRVLSRSGGFGHPGELWSLCSAHHFRETT